MEELPDQVARVCGSFVHALNESAEGLLEGLYLRGALAWDEYLPGGDIDFTAVLSRCPAADDLAALEAAHTQLWFEFPTFTFDGHHLVLADLRSPAAQCPPVPVNHHGHFVAGRLGLDALTWCELAERGIRVTGRDPGALGIHDDHDELWRHAVEELTSCWARRSSQLRLGWMAAGRSDEVVAETTLGVARLHHLVATGRPTSAGGAGHYVLERLAQRWHPLAADALRVRGNSAEPTRYRSLTQRGKDLRDFVAWCVQDGARRRPPGST